MRDGLFPATTKKPRLLRAPEPLESELRRAVYKYLRGAYVVCAVTDARSVPTRGRSGVIQCVYPAGWFDITAILPVSGRAWGIELKTSTGKLSSEQKRLHAQFAASGGLVTVARSLPEVTAVLRLELRALEGSHGARVYTDYLLKLRALESSPSSTRCSEE